MSHSQPPWASVRRSERLAGTPIVRRGAHWWMVSLSGTLLATDPAFTGELDRFAADLAAADQAVAALRATRTKPRKARS
ncbi:hypothetical protein ABII15_36100 [Streptomyces sp. HUAS MG91]|uniref:Uncharacterized protein n=1 Tax=Streptomyces tabacisoli TaxID=3156398 RepID=A0AAU8J3L0_9ACTN